MEQAAPVKVDKKFGLLPTPPYLMMYRKFN